MKKRLLLGTFFLVGLTFLKISIIMTNFQFLSFGENFSLSKHLEAYPRQI